MDKFTPGPWHVYQEKPHYYSIGTNYAHDCGHDQNIVRDVRKEANARLMAASPKMFAAISRFLAFERNDQDFLESLAEESAAREENASTSVWRGRLLSELENSIAEVNRG